MAPRWLKIEGDTVWACRFFAKRSPAVLPLCGLNNIKVISCPTYPSEISKNQTNEMEPCEASQELPREPGCPQGALLETNSAGEPLAALAWLC